jgi:uncharacterized membrane protein (DUF485 family)
MGNEAKASARILTNSMLVAIVIATLSLFIAFKPELLLQNSLMAAQLVIAIPMLITSTLSYSKVGYRRRIDIWDALGWMTFIIGYAFVMNVVGILASVYASMAISLAFFVTGWILTAVYSYASIYYEKVTIRERLTKDLMFILIQLVLGVSVVLHII